MLHLRAFFADVFTRVFGDVQAMNALQRRPIPMARWQAFIANDDRHAPGTTQDLAANSYRLA
jgi:hypothetical protein